MKLFQGVMILCSLVVSQLVLAEEKVGEPVELRTLRMKWQQADERQVSPLKEKYQANLQKLAGSLADAERWRDLGVVQSEIKRVTGEEKADKKHEEKRSEISKLNSLYLTYQGQVGRKTGENKKKYVGALKSLKGKFTKSGNIDGAIAVNAELVRINGESEAVDGDAEVSLPKTKAQLKKWLVGTKWTDKRGVPILEFHEKGKLTRLSGRGKPRYEVLSRKSIKVIWARGIVRVMTFERDYQRFYNQPRDGWFDIIVEPKK